MGRVSLTPVTFMDLVIAPESSDCPRCQMIVSRRWTTKRYAADLSLSDVSIMKITVGVYRCQACMAFFRNVIPFLRKKAKFTNNVVTAAIAAVIEDGMAVGRVPKRMQRDFGIHLSESTIRYWISNIQNL